MNAVDRLRRAERVNSLECRSIEGLAYREVLAGIGAKHLHVAQLRQLCDAQRHRADDRVSVEQQGLQSLQTANALRYHSPQEVVRQIQALQHEKFAYFDRNQPRDLVVLQVEDVQLLEVADAAVHMTPDSVVMQQQAPQLRTLVECITAFRLFVL